MTQGRQVAEVDSLNGAAPPTDTVVWLPGADESPLAGPVVSQPEADDGSLRRYEKELEGLQVELVKMQRWVQAKGRRIAILFEGRDAAGKGGTIRRFTEHLNP
ncbi:MAG: polyphosphate kinase 2, partial [Elusimicrobiota bacterium]